jgi:DNA repair protein RadC
MDPAHPAEQLAVPSGISRPAEAELRRRARLEGLDALEIADLIELVAGDAARGRLRSEADVLAVARGSPDEVSAALGLGRGPSWRLAAAFALGRRLATLRQAPRSALRSAAQVHELLGAELQGLERETFQVLCLDGKHRLKTRELVSIGSLTTSIVHPREVFRPAIRAAAAAVICAHNHPSGDPEPSQEDHEVTRRLQQAGRTLGIPLLDHVVLGDGRFVSMRERIAF